MAIKRAAHLAWVQLRELFCSPLFYAYLCLFFVYYHHLNQETVRMQRETGLWVNAWGYAAGVFSNGGATLVFGLGAVILFSDLPLIREDALLESVRCSRGVWAGGRVLYVFAVSVIYAGFMLLTCALTSRGRMTDPSAWGKALNTIANGYRIDPYSLPVELPLAVVNAFTPMAAFGVTMLMSVLASACVGMLMLCLSLGFGRVAALGGASVMALFDFLVSEKLSYYCYRLSPLSFTRLSIIASPEASYYPTIQWALTTLLTADALLSALALALAHRNRRFAGMILKEQY